MNCAPFRIDKQSASVFLQPFQPIPAGQTAECRFFVTSTLAFFWKLEAPSISTYSPYSDQTIRPALKQCINI